MNLTNLIAWSIGIITAFSGVQNIDSIQRSIWKAQSRLVYESRTETWGSPRYLVNQKHTEEKFGKCKNTKCDSQKNSRLSTPGVKY